MLLMYAGKKQSINRQLIAIVFIKKYDNPLFFRVDQAIRWKDSTSSHTLFLVVSDSAIQRFSGYAIFGCAPGIGSCAGEKPHQDHCW